MALSKAKVELGGVTLAGTGSVVWKLQTGTTPYATTFQVHREVWDRTLSKKVGQPLALEITNARGDKQTIREVYVLHEVPSDSPHRASFIAADRRWRWPYQLISRDYNVPKKSGDRTVLDARVPTASFVTVDRYDFKPYSLKNGERKWTAKEAVLDCLRLLTDDGGQRFFEESWPLQDDTGGEGSFSLQNVVIRDQGDAALAHLLGFIPGAVVYVDIGGVTRIIDGADLAAAEAHRRRLPPSTYEGDADVLVDRRHVRPSKVNVHYTREVECVFEYADDYSDQSTLAPLKHEDPFLENVIPTVDPETEDVKIADPDSSASPRATITVPKVAAGTWLAVDDWLEAMDADKPAGSLPWTFDTIRRHWAAGDLEGVLGGSGDRGKVLDTLTDANVAMRVQALKQHFRQTFRINPAYMDRIREVKAVRVGPLDPVTGARAHALVWGQYCIVPSQKAWRIAKRKDESRAGVWQNVDNLEGVGAGSSVVNAEHGPGRITFLDKDNGIFRVDWPVDPSGTEASIFPCNVVDALSNKSAPSRHLKDQDDVSMGPSLRRAGATNSIFLDKSTEMKVLVTFIPAAPNNKNQFHVERLDAGDVKQLFRTEFRIDDGEGPELDLFVSPGESTARFQWESDEAAKNTIKDMLGMRFDDPISAGVIPGIRGLTGFTWTNEQREIRPHSRAYAAEVLASFADALQGRVTTRMPDDSMVLKGNMSGATLTVRAAPNATVRATHEFPGQQRPISRFSLLSASARQLVLGIQIFKGET